MYQPRPALARRSAEHQFGRDQRAPGKGPADLQARQDRRQRGRHQDLQHVAQAAQPVVAPGHAQRLGHALEARIGVERQRPQHRVHQHEHQAAALPRPNHSSASGSSAMAGSGLNIEVSVVQQVAAELRRHRQRGQREGRSTPAHSPAAAPPALMRTFSISSPLARPSTSARAVCRKVGSSRSLSCQRAAAPRARRAPPGSPLRTPPAPDARASGRCAASVKRRQRVFASGRMGGGGVRRGRSFPSGDGSAGS
jgi:hypothetical protein